MSSRAGQPAVRARFLAARVPDLASPYDAIQIKVHYPARFTGQGAERLTGTVPPDPERAPWPVVVVINGVNVGPESYRWLAERLVPDGFAVVTYTMVGELFPPGTYGLTPGFDLTAAGPEAYGTRPTCTAVGPILGALAECDLALDLTRVVLGGHSAGGTLALQNARTSLVGSVRAAFSYAGHTLASAGLGWPSDDPLPVGDVPVLIMGGSRDGVIARSADRYGRTAHDRDPLTRTFETAGEGSILTIVEGATHQTFCHPHDPTVARGFLDDEPAVDEHVARALLGDLISAFLRRHARGEEADFDAVLDSPAFAVRQRR